MRGEYLLFVLVVAVPPLLLSFWRPTYFADRMPAALRACVLGAAPFIVWDAAVTGRHWWFDKRYTLGPQAFGLPIEELLFFLAVPLACLYAWEVLLRGWRARPRTGLHHGYVVSWSLVLPAVVLWSVGLEYTALALGSWAAVTVLDHALGTRMLEAPRYWGFIAFVATATLVFNGYLTARPVVHYDPAYQLDLRIFTIPVEDFLFGFSLMTAVTVVYQSRLGRARTRSWLARAVRRRLGGYRRRLVSADPRRPVRLAHNRSVAVIGGGLAGIGAAAELAERGFDVTLLERNAYLGGKIGAWTEVLEDGFEARIEHGFHAFFRHYYNLSGFLRRIGAASSLRPIDDYVIVARDGRRFSFRDVDTTPALNLISLARRGLYSLRRVAFGPAGRQLEAFLRYDAEDTLRRFDDVSFADFARRAELPEDLRLVFNTFSRAFFSDARRMSMADLIKSFHFYYLAHDHGLLYDYVDGDVQQHLLAPIERHLRAHGVVLRTRTAVASIGRERGRFVVGDERFDAVVLAADVRASRAIVGASPWLESADPELCRRLRRMRSGQRYAVLRLWLDHPAPDDLPVFVITERARVLDALAFLHRIDDHARTWAEAHGGCVLELHCYAIPDGVPRDRIQPALLEELRTLFPILEHARSMHAHLQIRDDFTAFHVGLGRDRPGTHTAVDGLVLAGDWVRLPCPAMLMEAAYTAGLLAANTLCTREGLRQVPIDTVPLRGLLQPAQARALAE